MPLTDQERSKYASHFHDVPVAIWKGELIEVQHIKRTKRKYVPARRGKVKGFTRASRLRMFRMVASVDWGRVPHGLFITLTYPDGMHQRPMGQRSTDKYLFLRAMEKYLDRKVGAIWRIEWKPRKTGNHVGEIGAHWHMIVPCVKFLPWQEVLAIWQRVLLVDGFVSTSCKGIKNGPQMARYVSKYCAKLPEADVLDNSSYLNSLGRHWGVNRPECIPFAKRIVIPFLTARDVNLVENLACMKFRFFTRGVQQGFSVFGEDAKKIGEILFGNRVDEEGNYWYPD